MELKKTVYNKFGSENVAGLRLEITATYKDADDSFVSAQAAIYDDSKAVPTRVGYATSGRGVTINLNEGIEADARVAIVSKIMEVFSSF